MSSSSIIDTTKMNEWEYDRYLSLPYEEIESAIIDENLITQDSYFKVYKAQLLQSEQVIHIVAPKTTQINLVANDALISKVLKHKNIATVFKLSGTKDSFGEEELIIINMHGANGSLDKHLSGSTLTWMQRLHICVKAAHALKYLNYDVEDDHHVLHCNIKSSKILLDHNWEPRLYDFAFALRAKKHHLHFTSSYYCTLQYMDPTYESMKALTHKSDVFSFGVVLFEVLFGREATIQNNDNWYFARLANSHFEESKLDDLIDPDLRKQMNLQSLNIFAETAYCCLKEQQSQRPNINQVISKLEKALELQHKHNASIKATPVEGPSSPNHLKRKNLDHLKFLLRDIELATNKFPEMYCIGSGGYGKVYKAQLNLDERNYR
ncbi:receptor-like protein kinase ANXUR1 [Bidens hawaiensis]|uniref:receptor-like protein kinase ANXUR1 n=1 Tax=Bidens hawaiensis TaxID=980011 RepID=UPI0040491E95